MIIENEYLVEITIEELKQLFFNGVVYAEDNKTKLLRTVLTTHERCNIDQSQLGLWFIDYQSEKPMLCFTSFKTHYEDGVLTFPYRTPIEYMEFQDLDDAVKALEVQTSHIKTRLEV